MWVKICGIRDVTTAEAVAALQPAAIGLNFYNKSPRFVELPVAVSIVEALRKTEVQPVGLFVNETLEAMTEFIENCQFPFAQLHGHESPEMMAALQNRFPHLKIIRAWRFGPGGIEELAGHLAACKSLGCVPWACLIDSHLPGTYGGTGTRLNWEELHRTYPLEVWPRLILAGGLTPDNVTEAIEQVQPFGVDVASGVESAPGVKDRSAVRRFIENSQTRPQL